MSKIMNTKLLLTASSVFMGLIGVALIFMPNEIIETLGLVPNKSSALTLQVTGALYFGFAMTNWMSKSVLIGGIYSRPLSVGNFSHFLIAGLALVKTSINSNTSSTYIFTLTIIYMVFAILFGYVTFTHPLKTQTNQ
ncbi:MAG: hypothetical protein WBQ32_03510 [Ignavibacteriaceae bacterium]